MVIKEQDAGIRINQYKILLCIIQQEG